MGASAHESQGHPPPARGQVFGLALTGETPVIPMGKMPMLREIVELHSIVVEQLSLVVFGPVGDHIFQEIDPTA